MSLQDPISPVKYMIVSQERQLIPATVRQVCSPGSFCSLYLIFPVVLIMSNTCFQIDKAELMDGSLINSEHHPRCRNNRQERGCFRLLILPVSGNRLNF